MDHGIDSCEAQTLIDRQILELQESIRKLRNQRNQHALVTKLPPEVLGEIFVYAEVFSRTAKGAKRISPTFYNFSFVSQDWRSVSLLTSEIWCHLSPERGMPEWSRLMLTRSKGASLTVESLFSRPQSTATDCFKEITQEHALRLVDLSISGLFWTGVAETDQSFLDGLPVSTPRLRVLRVKFERTPTVPVRLSGKNFLGASLATLELKCCGINWNSTLLTGLKVLKITNGSTPESLPELLGALERMPQLQLLLLSNSLPSHTPTPSSTVVPLFSLQQLRLSGPISGVGNLLGCLSVPTYAQIALRCTAETESSGDWREAFSASILRFFAAMKGDLLSQGPEFQLLSICADRQTLQTTVSGWRTIRDDRSFMPIPRDPPALALNLPTDDSLLQGVIGSLPLAHLNTLKLTGYEKYSLLTPTFQGLPTLETLILDGSTDFIKALGYNDRSSGGDHSATLPHIQNLFMARVVLSEHENIHYIAIESLLDCLMERCELGIPIHMLNIRDCWDIDQCDIGLLSEIVTDVKWDGHYIDYMTEEEDSEEENTDSDSDYYY